MSIYRESRKFINKDGKNNIFNKYYRNISPYIVSSENQSLIDIHAKLLEDRIIFLSGVVDDYLCDILKMQILYLEQIDNKSDIYMYINSPGGDVYSGLGLLDTMEYVSNDICTINTGLAASMAAVILSSGAKGKRKSLKRSRTMIHQPSGYLGYSQASDIEIEAKEINSLKKELYEILSINTGQEYEKVLRDGDRDYWMTAKDAKKYGIIDEVLIKRK